MKRNLINSLLGFALCLINTVSYSQQVNTITYAGSGLNTGICNVFNIATPAVIGGVTHLPLAGGVTFNGTVIDLQSFSGTTQATNTGTAFALQYPLKQGYSYSIKVTAAKASTDPVSQPLLTLSSFVNLPAAGSTNPALCGPVGSNNWMSAIGSVISTAYITSTTATVTTFPTFVAPANQGYLSFVISGGSTTAVTDVKITSIVLTESIALNPTPATVSIVCGTPLTQTFTINNPNNAAGINSYTWNLGTAPTGWQYNGSAAPSSIVTTANTITLTAPACGTLPNYITVAANLTGYNTTAGTIVPSLAPLSISGSSTLCGASGVYSIANLTCPGATVTWSVTPATGVVTPSCYTCSQTTLNKVGDGTVTLSAQITSPCTPGTTTLTYPIVVGTPQPDGICASTYTLCYTKGSSGSAVFSVCPTVTGLTYNWLIDGTLPRSGSSITINAATFGVGNHTLKVRSYSTACAVYSNYTNGSFSVVNCSSTPKVIVSPNPAGSTITVAASTPASAASSTLSKSDVQESTKIYAAKITDEKGIMYKALKYSAGPRTVNISVDNLKPGVYFLSVFDGASWITQQFVKQ